MGHLAVPWALPTSQRGGGISAPFASSGLRGRIHEPVSHARLGDEVRAGRVVVELLAQVAGVDPEILRFPPVLGAPDLTQQHPVGEDTAGVAGQSAQDANSFGVSSTSLPRTVTRWLGMSISMSPTRSTGEPSSDAGARRFRSATRTRASSSGVENGLVT